MSDGETPQHDPERNGDNDPPAGQPAGGPAGVPAGGPAGVPVGGSPGVPVSGSPGVPAGGPAGVPVGGPANTELTKLEPTKLEQVKPEPANDNKQLAHPREGVGVGESVGAGKGMGVSKGAWGGKGTWAAVSVLCVVVGAIVSLLAAHALARNDASKARATFQQSSSGIASNLKLAIQREEELAVSASTFFTANPKASHAEFATWVKWARTLHRYPELTNLGLLTVVPATQLPAFQAQISGHAPKAPAAGSTPTTAGSAHAAAGSGAGSTQATGTGLRATSSTGAAARPPTPTGPPLHIVPPSNHPYYCLAVAELARNPAQTPPPGLDYCASSAALLSARDSGLSSHTPLAAGPTRALAVETPVYRGNVTPRSLFGRRAASVGWLREVLLPGVLLQQALGNHPGYALRLRYRAGSANVAFTNGTPPSGAQSTTISLHNGWSVKSFAAAASTDVLADGDALALLLAGILLSALLGLLVFALCAPRTTHTPAPKPTGVPMPSEDLYDALTGLPNRMLTLDRAERMIARAGRDSGMLAGALFVDIDRLKDVNEKLGQAASDQLLRVVGERLEVVVRARRHRGPARWRRVRGAGRVGGPRGATGLARATHDRGAAQADRARRFWAELRPDREHRRCLRPLRDGRGPAARRAPGADLSQDRREGSLHALQRQHAHHHRGARDPRGRAEHGDCGATVLPALPADLRSRHAQGGGSRGADPLDASHAGSPGARETSSGWPRKPG